MPLSWPLPHLFATSMTEINHNDQAPEPRVSEATLTWKQEQPYSEAFDDVYFSSDSGLDETDYVFMQHNRLAERWQSLNHPHFTIGETGFGTGLNFLSAWRLWASTAPSNARLHYVSTELYPIHPRDLARALSQWPELRTYSEALLTQYAHLSAGMHRLVFANGSVMLTLLIGDAANMLGELSAKVDAWFLDGFSPAKNPAMWSPALFSQLARLSNEHTTFATFTSASVVRKGLQSAGFNVFKDTGFGRKREMLYGHFMSSHAWSVSRPQHVAVIGGGISGASTSAALASRGIQVTLIEQHEALAQEASGNPAGVLYPRLGPSHLLTSRLASQSFLFSLGLIKRYAYQLTFNACGLLQLGFNQKELARITAVSNDGYVSDMVQLISPEQASALAGIQITHSALWLPEAGWINPPKFCQALVDHPRIHTLLTQQALKLSRQAHGWQILGSDGVLAEADAVVIANAHHVSQFVETAHCETRAVRGQISMVTPTETSLALKTVVCTEGYITPAHNHLHCIGATFQPDSTNTNVQETDHLANLETQALLGLDFKPEQVMSGRASIRCTTADYLPLLGKIIDVASLTQAKLRHNSPMTAIPYHEGLFVNVGHGAKGLSYAPYCAEILASAMCGEPLPADNILVASLDPNRFLLRKMGLKSLARGLVSPYDNASK